MSSFSMMNPGCCCGSSGGTTGGTTVNIPTCCPAVPTTLSVNVTGACASDPSQYFRACTLNYETPPACFAGISLTTPIFISTTTFIDPNSGSSYYYWLRCQNNLWSLTRIFCTSPYGSPYRDADLYQWVMGIGGNTCSPFALTSGNSEYAAAGCTVTVTP